MKKVAAFLVATVLLVLVSPVALSGQDEGDTQKITVKSKEVSNGVVILTVQGVKNSFELQCNQGVSGCTVLEPGDYVMVRLPKNRGLYDCANAEVYRKSAGTETGDKLGQYCLVQTR